MRTTIIAAAAAMGLAGLLLPLLAAPAAAHGERKVGSYNFVVGFGTEPAYAGVPNSVQLILSSGGKPVTDLGVRLDLRGAEIVDKTTTRIRGDQGHVHLYVDGKLVTMNYGLRERLPQLTPGQHVVQVEFVAADHAPFEPRVLTQAAFEVAP